MDGDAPAKVGYRGETGEIMLSLRFTGQTDGLLLPTARMIEIVP